MNVSLSLPLSKLWFYPVYLLRDFSLSIIPSLFWALFLFLSPVYQHLYTLAMPSHPPPIFLQSHIPFSSLLSWPNLWKETSTASPHPMHSSLSFNPLDTTQSSICLTSSSIQRCHTLSSLPNTLFSCLPWPTFQLPSTSLVNPSQSLCWCLLLCLSSSVGSISKVLIFGPPCYRCCTLLPYDLIPLMTVSSLSSGAIHILITH